ncbi:MAG: cyclase family protein [Thermoanaerobaculia bacterium]|nr:cyclase family protein [Thermoanaerobaculia bacterium]
MNSSIRLVTPCFLVGVAILGTLTGCAPATEETATVVSPAPPGFDLTTARVVDLTWSLGEETLYWPTSPNDFHLEPLSFGVTDAGFFYAANEFSTPEHGGTHLDAPIHFGEGKQFVNQVPVDRLVRPAVVIDVTESASEDPDYLLTVQDLEAFETAHGRIQDGSMALLNTGWSKRWPDRLAYFGSDLPNDASDLHFPSFGVEAARWLIEERGVLVLGVDTASIDYGPSTDFLVHRLASEHQVPGLENLTHLDQLPAVGAWVVALPTSIEGGSGAPLRAIGLIAP